MKIKLLLGGSSSERDVSISSGLSVYNAIESDFDVELVYLNDNYVKELSKVNFKESIVFNALHGGYGENGELQSYLEQFNIPFTGSNSRACKIAMSKNLTKIMAKEASIPTALWSMDINNFTNIPYPLIVKPDDQGSTMGLTAVQNKNEINTAVKLAKKYSPNVMIEEFIPGRELTVGIVNDHPLPIVEIIPKSGFYDFESKYTKGQTDYECPAQIDGELAFQIQKDALKLFKMIGCKSYGRVDFRLNGDKYYMLEINTHPGMTDTSLLPMAAKEIGLSFKALILEIIKK